MRMYSAYERCALEGCTCDKGRRYAAEDVTITEAYRSLSDHPDYERFIVGPGGRTIRLAHGARVAVVVRHGERI